MTKTFKTSIALAFAASFFAAGAASADDFPTPPKAVIEVAALNAAMDEMRKKQTVLIVDSASERLAARFAKIDNGGAFAAAEPQLDWTTYRGF